MPRPLDALIVGAGFSGVYLLDQLRERGFAVRIFEAGADLGGIWHWNVYPGARVDSPCWIYQFSREAIWREWSWSEKYPGFEEMRAYFDFVDRKLDLRRDIAFETRVEHAAFDEHARTWQVRAQGPAGEVTAEARFLLLCTGFASQPYVPPIDGLDRFAGACHHTALWPQQEVELRGKRVGVLGTGASGVQVAQEAAPVASQLTVFQRTPNLCLPMNQEKLDEAANERLRKHYPEWFAFRAHSFGGMEYDVDPRSALDATPEERDAHYEALWAQGGFRYWIGTYEDVLRDEAANRTAYDFWRDKVRARIEDPALAEKLAPSEPPHPFGVKRPSLEQRYYEIYNQPNVELVDLRETPIVRVDEEAVETTRDRHELDVLALATGFDAVSGGLMRLDLRGTGGVTLGEKWAEGVRSFQGLANAGFPNLMVAYGPQAPTAFCNGPSSAELQGAYIVECLAWLREHGKTRIEATAEAEEAWRRQCLELADQTLFPKGDSWYMGANIPGKRREMLMFPGGLPAYLEQFGESAAQGYAGYRID